VSLPHSVASGNGDPHYTSFDNKRYDFVAAGEYILFGTSIEGNNVFHVQGRLGPRGWPATTTVALAFGVPGVYAYQVSLIMIRGCRWVGWVTRTTLIKVMYIIVTSFDIT
jgi:hypothetical protein